MADEETPLLSLATMHGGGLVELADKAILDVLANIQDPNVKTKGKRSIVITIDFHPTEEGDFATIEYKVSTKPQQMAAQSTRAYLSTTPGRLIATEFNPKQDKLSFERSEDGKVVSINGR